MLESSGSSRDLVWGSTVIGTRGRRFAGGRQGVGSSRSRRLLVSLVAVALLFCHGAFGYAHQVPAVDVHAAHAAHAMGVDQPGQGQTSVGSHLQEAYFATLLLLLFGAALLMGGWLPAGAKLRAPSLRADNKVWRLHPPRGPTPSRLQVFRL